MKRYKGLIVAVSVLAIYAVLMIVMFGNKSSEDKKDTTTPSNIVEDYYLVVEENSYKYVNNNIIKTGVSSIESLSEMDVYLKNKYAGKYHLKYGNTWNVFDENETFISGSDGLIAASTNLNLKTKNFKIRELNEKDKYNLINKYNISTFSYLTTNQVVDIDLDDNGVEDEIICLSSKEESQDGKYYFDLVVIKLNDEYYTLIDQKEDSPYIYEVYAVLNILDNSKDSVVIKRSMGIYSDDLKQDYLLINYVNNNYSID